MAYVTLGRVTSLSQLYLNKFDQARIYCDPKAKAEALRLESRAINLKKDFWEFDHDRSEFVKICSINARSLKQHATDLKNDRFLMNSDIIAVQETWMDTDNDVPSEFTHWPSYYVHAGSKGIALLTKDEPCKIVKYKTSHCSLIKATYEKFDILNIYRHSDDTNISSFAIEIISELDVSKTQIIVGDMNIDIRNVSSRLTDALKERGFTQLVTRPTHDLGGLIDHVYFASPSPEHSCSIYKYHTVFWSDHLCLGMLLKMPHVKVTKGTYNKINR